MPIFWRPESINPREKHFQLQSGVWESIDWPPFIVWNISLGVFFFILIFIRKKKKKLFCRFVLCGEVLFKQSTSCWIFVNCIEEFLHRFVLLETKSRIISAQIRFFLIATHYETQSFERGHWEKNNGVTTLNGIELICLINI